MTGRLRDRINQSSHLFQVFCVIDGCWNNHLKLVCISLSLTQLRSTEFDLDLIQSVYIQQREGGGNNNSSLFLSEGLFYKSNHQWYNARIYRGIIRDGQPKCWEMTNVQ